MSVGALTALGYCAVGKNEAANSVVPGGYNRAEEQSILDKTMTRSHEAAKSKPELQCTMHRGVANR